MTGTGTAGRAVDVRPGRGARLRVRVPGPDRRGQTVPAQPDRQPRRRHHRHHATRRPPATPRPTWPPATRGGPPCRSRSRWSRSTSTTDDFSGTTLTSEYRYHHGYWDGADREFRGFARVDQRDTPRPPPRAAAGPFYTPPTETRTWFHLGPGRPRVGRLDRRAGPVRRVLAGGPAAHRRTADVSGACPRSMNRRACATRSARSAAGCCAPSSSRSTATPMPNARTRSPSTPTRSPRCSTGGRPPTRAGKRCRWSRSSRCLDRTSVWERGTEPMTQASLHRRLRRLRPPRADGPGRRAARP